MIRLYLQTALSAAMLVCVLLSGCGGGTERQQAYYEKALAFYEAGNIEKASVEIRNALQINGDFAEGRYLHALIHEKDQNWQQMWANLNLVVQLDPNHLNARVKLGQMQFMMGETDAALTNVDEVLKREPGNADALALRASVLLKQGDTAAAIAAANTALQHQPGHIGAIAVLSEAYKQQDPDRALAIIGEGLKQVGGNEALNLLRIDVLVSTQRIDDALQAFRELIAAHPENLFFHYRLITLLEAQGRLDEAEAQLRTIVQARPDNTQLKLWLADFLARQRDVAQAETVLRQFLAQQPDLGELQLALGKVLIAQGKLADAETTYRQLATASTGTAIGLEARNALVLLYLLQGQEARGQEELAAIFAEEPENTEALTTRARMALAQGRTQDAIGDLRTVTRNHAEAIDARLLLARAHEMEGDNELALDNYRQILALQPGNLAALTKAARQEMRFNRLQEAEKLLKSALAASPGQPQATGMLVELYGGQGRWSEGQEYAAGLVAKPELAAYGHYLEGRLRSLKGDLAGAEAAYRESLQTQPAAIEPLNFLVITMAQEGRIGEARAYLETHLRRYPEHTHAAQRLGELLLQTDPAEALRFYQGQIGRLEGSPQARHVPLLMGLAQAWQANRQPEQALRVLQQAELLAPQDAAVAVMLAGQHHALGHLQEAVRYYEQALRHDPDQIVAANNLANLYLEELYSPENLAKAQALAKVLRGTQHPVFLDTLGLISYHGDNLPSAISFFESALSTGQAPVETHYHLARALVKQGQGEAARVQLDLAAPKIVDPKLKQKVEALKAQLSAQG